MKLPGPSPQPRRAAADKTERPLAILVLEDDPMIGEALRRVLTLRGHTVHLAKDVPEASRVLEVYGVDAALVDMGVPGDGATILSRLEADPTFDGVAVLMTGLLAADPKGKVGSGVRRIQKPFRFRDVVPLLEGREE